MPRKRKNTSFEKALDHARTRLAEALQERVDVARTIGALDAEIPALQKTIQVLQIQMGGPSAQVPMRPSRLIPTPMPSELAALVPPDVDPSMGSAFDKNAPAPVPSEDELLPEPEGKEMLP